MQTMPKSPPQVLPTKVEEVALEIGAALSGLELHRSSIHDATGEPDVDLRGQRRTATNMRFMLDALDCFALEPARACFEREMRRGPQAVVAYCRRAIRAAHCMAALLLDVNLRSLGWPDAARACAMPQFATAAAAARACAWPIEQPADDHCPMASLTATRSRSTCSSC